MILYHFVCPWRLEFIQNNGCIKARCTGDDWTGDRPVVWLTKSPEVQMFNDGPNLGLNHRICLKLKVPTKDPNLHHMLTWRRANMLSSWRDEALLDKVGWTLPRDWWVYFGDIPITAIKEMTFHRFNFQLGADGVTQEDLDAVESRYQEQLAKVLPDLQGADSTMCDRSHLRPPRKLVVPTVDDVMEGFSVELPFEPPISPERKIDESEH
jgi:hypothetical protein